MRKTFKRIRDASCHPQLESYFRTLDSPTRPEICPGYNGKEFASHAQIATSLGALSYFAKPYHSWERGLNEHTNGLFRQYFPKGSDFSILSDADVQRVEDKLNSRPRKILGYQTPREIFFSARNLPVALHC